VNNLETYQKVDSYWYDRVPSYWKKTKNKYVFCQDKHVVGEDWEKFTLLTMGKSGVKPRDMDGGGKFPASFETYQTVEPNQLVFCLFDLDETPRTIGMSKDYGMITSAYDVFTTTEGNDPQFWTYFYQMIDDHKGLRPFYTGLRKVVRSDTFMGIEVFSPPLEEQKLISRYLDKKTKQIDCLVEKIQEKIELLKEQRTSLINKCVTKGLDPNVEMKDSGVEWIGEIPKPWKTLRLCNFGLFSKGKNITKGDLVELGKPVILYSHLYTTYSRLVEEPKFFISDDFELNSTKIYKNTFLFTSSGESKEDIGKCILYVGDETSVGGDQVIFKLKSTCNFDPEFLSFSFNSDFCVNQKSSNSRGEIVVHIYEKQLRDVVIPIPPENEQIVIRRKLRKIEKNSDEIIRNLEHKRELLKEYRQSLISSAVTGKIRITEDMI